MPPQEIANFIDKATTCLVSSVDPDGFPQTRAMGGVSHREGVQTLYFSTNTSSQKVQHFRANKKASVYFYDELHFIGLLIIWTMEVTQEKADKDVVRKEGDELYYPKGFDDPDFAVLKFTSQKMRKYSNFHVEERAV